MATTKKRAARPAANAPASPSSPHRLCSLPAMPQRHYGPEVSPLRAEILIVNANKWVNGTVLRYYFFQGSADGSPDGWRGTGPQQEAVRQGFQAWKAIGLGLDFQEVDQPGDAQIRIGFQRGDGSWSYIGRDVLDPGIGPHERTMNFGWDVRQDADTILHEIGHTLGFPHEHQNPFSGIVWNEEAVYAALAAPPNRWDRNRTYHNIIRKLETRDVEGSPHDPASVMHYPFEAGLILEPPAYRSGLAPPGGLSAQDIAYARQFYPPLTHADYKTVRVGKAESMTIGPGEQRNFRFRPKFTRTYNMHTLGEMDTVMVLFERIDGNEIQIAGDDDSGRDYNARIRRKLVKGREYVIRIRLFYRSRSGETLFVVL